MRGSGALVLVVASEPELGTRVCAALGRLGLASTLAATGAEAVHRLSEDAPVAIVVDLGFRDMDPQLIVQRALRCRETHGSPVVVLADTDIPDRDMLLDLGCAAILDRDADPQDVARTIATSLSGGTLATE